MKSLLAKYWFFFGMAAMVAAAFAMPDVGAFIKRWNILNVGIFCSFLATGLTLETRRIGAEARNVRAILTGLASCFVLFPAVARLLGWVWFGQDIQLLVGICILATAPATMASGTILTAVAGGNVPLSLMFNVTTHFAAIFLIPLLLKVLLGGDTGVSLPVLAVMQKLSLLVLLPVLLGQILRPWVKDRVVRCRKGFSIFGQCVVLLIILNAVASSVEETSSMGWGVVNIFGYVIVLHVLVLGMNWGLGRAVRLNGPSTSALVLHISQKSLGLSFIVWDGFFSEYRTGFLFMIAYHIVQLIMDTYVAHGIASRTAPAQVEAKAE
jgi:predicted Na+-dependent transporter